MVDENPLHDRRDLVSFAGGKWLKRWLWQAIPPAYRRCRTYTDFWKAHQVVLPKRTHHLVGKETGQTAHQERWYLTLGQRVSRFVRKTLSCSKSERNHELVTRWFFV